MENNSKKLELKCIKQSFNGKGIVKYNDNEYEIDNMIIDEVGVFNINKNNVKRPLELVSIIKKSEKRLNSSCQYHKECGGCQYQHMTYEAELELKKEYVKDIFKNFKDVKIKDIIRIPSPNNYRGKLQMTYKMSKAHKVVCGFYEEGTHNIIPVFDCKIQAKKGTEVINALNEALTKNKIEPYNEKTRKGVVRHVLVRFGFNTNEILVCIVTNGEFFPGRKNVVNDLIKKNLGVTSIVQNYNSRDTSIVLGDKERILYGRGFINDTCLGMNFRISSKSFYQVNPVGMELLYKKALEVAKIKKSDTVLDTYCGVGTIGLIASKEAKQVIGVELNKDAYNDALLNAKFNDVKNITFYNDDSTKFMTKLSSTNSHVDVLIMDPPREGSTDQFIEGIGRLKPNRIVYVSCDPKTLERDLYKISKVGYHVESLDFVDMFPRTFHVESVVLMSRVQK